MGADMSMVLCAFRLFHQFSKILSAYLFKVGPAEPGTPFNFL
jgi:hypothetical protein